LKLPEIVSFTAETNVRSQKLMRRLGFQHDTRDDFNHPALPEGHILRLHVLYRKKRDALPLPPEALSFGQVRLRFVQIIPRDPACGFVPAYHFRILDANGADAGHINFRVGDTEHVRVCAGHIGFEVLAPARGHGYAFEACRALAPLVWSFYDSVTITCNPDNVASIRTIERLGARFIDEVPVPSHDPHFQHSRSKKRYQWTP
jgi:RimJ/RimL family protein N-acetyltransferase